MCRLGRGAILLIAMSAVGNMASAAMISYVGTLSIDGPTEFGSLPSVASFDDPLSAEYWRVSGTAGERVAVTVRRLEGDLDPALWVFEGEFSDTDEFAGGADPGFDESDPGFVVFGDDELSPILPGPYGDVFAQFTFSLPAPGIYTLAVTNFLSESSDGGDGQFDYSIAVATSAVPEPSSFALLGLTAIGGLAFRMRNRRASNVPATEEA